MAKSNYAVVAVDLSNPIKPESAVINCMNMNEATAEFQSFVKKGMQTKFRSCYNGTKPKPGYSHSLSPTDYRLVISNGPTNSLVFYVGIVSTTWASGSSGASAAATSCAPVSAGSGSAGKPGPKGTASAKSSGNTTKVVVGGRTIEIDQNVLAAALGAALSSVGTGGSSEEDEDDDESENE